MAESVKAGYLLQTEANRVGIRPGPNVVYLRLMRELAAESGASCMFAEMTPGHVLHLIDELQSAVRIALAHA